MVITYQTFKNFKGATDTIHQRNLRAFAIELYETSNNLSPVFMRNMMTELHILYNIYNLKILKNGALWIEINIFDINFETWNFFSCKLPRRSNLELSWASDVWFLRYGVLCRILILTMATDDWMIMMSWRCNLCNWAFFLYFGPTTFGLKGSYKITSIVSSLSLLVVSRDQFFSKTALKIFFILHEDSIPWYLKSHTGGYSKKFLISNYRGLNVER